MFLVPNEMSLLEALHHLFPDSSKRTLQNLLKFQRVKVDGAIALRGDTALKIGQKVEIAPKANWEIPGKLEVIFEDRYLIVIDKQEGLLTVSTESRTEEDAIFLLREAYKTTSIYPVHRLDRETSGILVTARGQESQRRFDELFEQHDIERCYFAIVEGRVVENEGVLENDLLEKENFNVIVVHDGKGKKAITHFKVLHRSKKFTYLLLKLETGRKHQIRVQLSNIGHPVVGDKRYGSTINPISRVCLHAVHLGFIHPFTGKKMAFDSPLPKSFAVIGATDSMVPSLGK